MAVYVTGQVITFTYVLLKTGSPPATKPDIRILYPTNIVEYDDSGTTHSATYTAPTDVADGQYQFTKTLADQGSHSVSITVGTTISHVIWSSIRLSLQDHNPNFNSTISRLSFGLLNPDCSTSIGSKFI